MYVIYILITIKMFCLFLAFSYRSEDSSGNEPYFKLDWNFPRSHKPALLHSSSNSAQPRGPLDSSDPSYTDGSSETLKPAAVAPSTGGYRGSYGRQLDGYNPERSVYSYTPGPLISLKPRETPQQQGYQHNLNVKRVPHNKGMGKFLSPQTQKVNRYELGVVSSHAIEITSGHQSEPKPQQLSHPAWPQQPSHLAQHPSFPYWTSYLAWPQQPGYLVRYPYHPQRPSYPAQPQQSSYPFHPQHTSYPKPHLPGSAVNSLAKPQQLSSSDSMTHSKDDMWKFALPRSRNRIESGIASSRKIVMHSGLQSKAEAEAQLPQQNHLAQTQSQAGNFDVSQEGGFRSIVQPSDSNPQMNVDAGIYIPKVVRYIPG